MGLEIAVRGPATDLHSGLHGGVLHNPIEALSELIASLRTPDGRIAVAGFYDDVAPFSAAERAAIAAVPDDEEAYRRTLGVPAFFGEPGYTTRERNWIRPTMALNGIWGGFQGQDSKTVIPSLAQAKITCRLVANQRPDRVFALFEQHIHAYAPAGVTVSVQRLPGSSAPYLASAGDPGNVAAAEVLTALFDGNAPYPVYVGGSIPVATYFEKHLGTKMINFGWSAPDEQLHAPNEFFRLKSFRRGLRGYCLLLQRLAAYPD
jgi:acetylornithine deacetylase/succinyl-diaminopimelate desuccinylase-like protein